MFRIGNWLMMFIGAIFVISIASPALARVSPWIETSGGAFRLIAGGEMDKAILAGVEIELDEGWKTYWRSPGDSGIPPEFNFSGSLNIEKVELLWPAPKRFNDSSGDSVGYKTNVLFPLRIIPLDADKPVQLMISAFYGVCSDICVPVQISDSLRIPVSRDRDGWDAKRISKALKQIPGAHNASLHISGFEIGFDDQGKKFLEITVNRTNQSTELEMFLEPPGELYLDHPVLVTSQDQAAVFRIDLENVDMDDLDNKESWKVTLVSDDFLVEQDVQLQ